ncbi:U2 small nuclear ribonucleoprotein auxiliary factor 35 kDa subunit-related protein 2 [Formica exsecta]|uniref:U2 small nuclear ribonucleoprotein auxiliary factor 35 kDa subunit-related protein 2 n=1 Tax=Formica exsecta TaxID=72781 RepID=UPI0011433BBA|nr:U2 small nuclear ribonucleoprotein auxiliary factor 35 kDa subunit-related protein 2 [Formica exsecta]
MSSSILADVSEDATMEGHWKTKPSHKEWRRIAKRERRRRIRQKAAQERDANEEKLRAALMSNMEYLNRRAEQEKEKKEKEAREQEEHAERNRLWLEEEVRAQKKWQVLQEQKAKEEQQRLEQEMKIRKEFEARLEAIQKKKEEEKRKREEQLRKQEQLQKEIDDYIDNGMKTPEALREVIDNQPSKDICPFFTKTGVCRYGDMCSKNHRRVFLSKVILIPGFYTHFSLEKNSAEYDTDIGLEFESSETWHHFREFYEDVITELESFGKIKTLRCCCNTEIHLRGNLYVEYYTEREAARAWRNLKGRRYASKQLNCEFVNLTSWRNAICGMPKCPKGSRACNFLHTFRNPHDEYGIKSPPRRAKGTFQDSNNSKRSERSNKSKLEESVRDDNGKDRNWRWSSESPEIEINDCSKDSERKRSHSTERRSRRSLRDKRHSQSERSSSSRSKTSSKKRRSSRSKRAYDDEDQDKKAKLDMHSSKRHEKGCRKRRSDSENGHKTSRRKY